MSTKAELEKQIRGMSKVIHDQIRIIDDLRKANRTYQEAFKRERKLSRVTVRDHRCTLCGQTVERKKS